MSSETIGGFAFVARERVDLGCPVAASVSERRLIVEARS
jgi:hypothetical protein